MKKILSALGLNGQESEIYLQLLQGGGATAGELARKTGMVRPTLYAMLKDLRDRGIVIQGLRRGVRDFHAEAPEKLGAMLQTRLDDMQKQNKRFQEMMPLLQKRAAEHGTKPAFQFFDGKDGVKNVMMDMLLYRNITSYVFWPMKAAVELLTPAFFKFHNMERIRNGMHVKGIWAEGQHVNLKRLPFLAPGEKLLREIRVAPPGVDASMGYWIYGDKVACLSSARECYGFIIESAEFSAMLKKQHEFIWKASRPLACDPKDIAGFLAEIGAVV